MVSAVVALALGIAACGGADKSSGGTLGKDEFVKRANAVCMDSRDKAKAVKQPSNIRDAKAASDYLDKVAPILDDRISKLKELKAPADVKSAWDTFIAKQQEGAKILATARQKAKAKDAGGLKDLQRLQAVGAEAKAAATKAGATDCVGAT